jgi:ketosteroid isomerase-like protein
LDHFPVTARETNVNEAGRQVTIWATGKPQFKKGAMGGASEEEWDYTNEYIFILDVDEEGKIIRIVEFLDSLKTERLRGAMVKARENIGKTGAAW